MHQAVQAYNKTAKVAASPRDLEAGLLIKAAARLQSIRESWDGSAQTLHEALYFNRKLWTVLVSSATKDENPLPKPIKQNIANLGLFVFNRTLEVQTGQDVDKIDILVTINREIAAGLSSNR